MKQHLDELLQDIQALQEDVEQEYRQAREDFGRTRQYWCPIKYARYRDRYYPPFPNRKKPCMRAKTKEMPINAIVATVRLPGVSDVEFEESLAEPPDLAKRRISRRCWSRSAPSAISPAATCCNP